VQSFEPIRNNRHCRAGWPRGRRDDHAGLNAVKQNSKSRKAGVSTVEIALDNIEKRNWCLRFEDLWVAGSHVGTLGAQA